MGMEVILYDPKAKDATHRPQHVTVLDAQGRHGKHDNERLFASFPEMREHERMHQACIAGETKGEAEETKHHSWGGPDGGAYDEVIACDGTKNCPIHAHRLYPCAACDWTAPEVKKLRQAKRTKVLAAQRGKLPPLRVFDIAREAGPKPLTDAEARKVVLPTILHADGKMRPHPDDTITKNVAEKYLLAVGSRKVALIGGDVMGNKRFSCGCVVEQDCESHYYGGKASAINGSWGGQNKFSGDWTKGYATDPRVNACERHARAFGSVEQD